MPGKNGNSAFMITPFGRHRNKIAPFEICSCSEHYERRIDESLDNPSNIIEAVDDQERIYGGHCAMALPFHSAFY